MKKLLLKFMQSSVYGWFLKRVIPYVRFTLYYTSLRGWKYKRGYNLLRAGDILLTIDNKKLTTFLIPGEFSHAALTVAVNPTEEWEISEMTHTDYTKSTFFDLCKESDRVVILRCPDWDEQYIQEKVIPMCKSLENAKYDVQFDLGIQALYCSELIYHSDVEKRLEVDLSDLAGLGRPYLSPDGLWKAQNVVVVWDSDRETQQVFPLA
jgi:hypothetical protein